MRQGGSRVSQWLGKALGGSIGVRARGRCWLGCVLRLGSSAMLPIREHHSRKESVRPKPGSYRLHQGSSHREAGL